MKPIYIVKFIVRCWDLALYVVVPSFLLFLVLPDRNLFLEIVKHRLWLVFLMAGIGIPCDYIWSLMLRGPSPFEPLADSPMLLWGREGSFKLLVITWWVTEAAICSALLICCGFKTLTAVYGGYWFVGAFNTVVMRLLGKASVKLRLCELAFPDAGTCLLLSPLLMFLACIACLMWL